MFDELNELLKDLDKKSANTSLGKYIVKHNGNARQFNDITDAMEFAAESVGNGVKSVGIYELKMTAETSTKVEFREV